MRHILSAVWAGGKLGCAFYEKETAQLLVLPDVADSQPDFEIFKLILRQVNPSAVIVSSRQDERFLNALRSLSRRSNGGAEMEGGRWENQHEGGSQFSFVGTQPGSVASADHYDDEGFCVHVLRGKDFAPDPCKSRLLRQRLPEEPPGRSDKEHLLYIQSLLPFSNDKMVRAAGALLMFLDEHASSYGIDLLGGAIPVLDIVVWQLDDLVLVDDTAWESLQIFSSELHSMGAKRTRYCKEGLSLYNHLNRCRTAQGTKFLRLMLSRPVRNVNVLKRRHDVIEYCCHPTNMDFVKSASECLKGTKNLPALLSKIALLHPSAKDWRELYQTLYQYVALADVMGHQRGTIELFAEILEPSKLNAIKVVVEEMMRVIDFNQSKHEGRLVPNVGVSRELDTMRKQYSALPQVMTEIAAEEILNLPEYIQQCSIIYLPEVGFRLAVISSEEEEEMDLDGYEFQFTNNNNAYFRSNRTIEMDAVFGDLVVGMLDVETNVMLNLAGIILVEKNKLLEIGALMSELDCLMALSAVSNECNFVRPNILPAREMLEIKDGRHPLVASVTAFVPNSTSFEGEERLVVLTGPNASGKSVYLKQVGIIALMALCGSFVPATSARIPLYDRICTRIHVCESLSSGLSAFMADINQMTLALRTSTASSLVLVDEFGKGTAEADGLGLLVASLENFLQRVQECPTVFLSTHFYSITEYLQATSLIKMQTMQFTEDQNQIVYLHKLKDGICQSSLAFVVAKAAGIEDAVVQRSLEIGDAIQRQLTEDENLAEEPSPKELILLEIGSNFLSMQIDEESVKDYLEFIRSRVASFRLEDVVMGDEEDRNNNEGHVATDNEEYLATPLQTQRTYGDRGGVIHDDQIDDGESLLYTNSSVLDDTIDSNTSPASSGGGYCGPPNSVGIVSVVPYSFGSSTTTATGNFNEDLEERSFYFNAGHNSRD